MMTVEHFDLSKTGSTPRHYEAAELAGDLGRDEFLARYSFAELETIAQAHHEAAEGAMLLCAADVVEFCRRAGPQPTNRAKALKDYAQLTGRGTWQVYQMFLVGRFYTPERKEAYPTVTYEHLSSAIRYTHREGDTPDRRDERIERVVREAADADLNIPKTRTLAQNIDRDPSPTRGELLDPYEAAPAPEPEPPAPTVLLEPSALVAGLTRGLERRLIDEAPGKWSDIAECLRGFLLDRLAAGWRLEAPIGG